MRKNIKEMSVEFDNLLKEATEGVKPPDYMIRLYNFIGKIPLKLGVVIFLLTGIDTIKVATRALRKRTDAAIQVLYDYKFRPWRLIWGIGDHFWQMSYNCRSVRARGIFTREAIKILLRAASKNEVAKIDVVSLGSGSGSQMLQGIADNNFSSDNIYLTLVDNDFRALEMGRINARKLNIEDLIDTREISVGRFLREKKPESTDLFEMVGLTDYFNNDRFSRYLEDIYKALKKGGFFIGANISSEEEAIYAHGVACWPQMYYRGKVRIQRFLNMAGFTDISNMWISKCGLYTFWIVQK